MQIEMSISNPTSSPTKPSRKYDVILYGDSIYYVPPRRIPAMLNRYSRYLTAEGAFVARIFDVSGKRQRVLDIIESHFEVVEKLHDAETQVCVIVFRPIQARLSPGYWMSEPLQFHGPRSKSCRNRAT